MQSPAATLANARSGLPQTSPELLPELVATPYAEAAVFALVMLLAALVLILFMRPGNAARMVAGIPFSLFILALIAIPLQAVTGFRLLDFSMAGGETPTLSLLRLAGELLCYYAAWQCIPWLYLGKEKFIDFCVRLLTKR